VRFGFPKIAMMFFALLCLSGFTPLDGNSPPDLKYEQFLEWRDAPDTVVIDSFQLEPLFHIVPNEMRNEQDGLSQAELDGMLKKMIPSKDTRVILFCEQNFAPYRTVTARNMVAWSLAQLGYKNVFTLEDIWAREDLFSTDYEDLLKVKDLADKEIRPYAVSLPQETQSYLGSQNNAQQEDIK